MYYMVKANGKFLLLYVTELPVAPNTFSGISGHALRDRYWAVNIFGTPGSFSASLTFTVPEGSLSTEDSQLQLYRRSSNSIGGWTAVGTLGTITATTVQFTGITSFSQFTLGSEGDSSLPVELSAFHASIQDGTVVLRWVTESELECAGFRVHRAFSEDGNYRCLNVTLIPGAGNTTIRQHYSFRDEHVESGETYWYKLEDIAYNGECEWHGPLSVFVPQTFAPMTYRLFATSPNPVNMQTTIRYQLPEAEFVCLRILNLLGQPVATLVSGDQTAGEYRLQFDTAILSSGTYLYELRAGEFIDRKKFCVLK